MPGTSALQKRTPNRDPAPGMALVDIFGAVAGTSPITTTFTLPAQGIYLATISAWEKNQQQRATAVGLLKWYSANNANNWTNKWNLLGAVDLSNAAFSAFAISDPTTAGVVTLTWTFSDAGSQPGGWRVRLRTLSTQADEMPF